MFELPHTIALISHASKVMLKILQARLQQYVNCEIPDIQAGFRKGRGTRDQIANICCIIKKAREFQKKNLLLLYWLRQSLWFCRSQKTGKFFKRWEYQTTLPASWKTYMQVKKWQSEPAWNKGLVPAGKADDQGCMLSPCLFKLYAEGITWNAGLEEAQAGTNISGGNINKLRYADDTTLMAESEEDLKCLWRVKELA